MGILRSGLQGGISGKIGNMVCYRVLGKDVVRIKGKIIKPRSEKQLMNQHDMKVAMDFLRPIQEFIKLGFALAAKQDGMYPHNKALSINRKRALTGIYPERMIDFSKVQLSKGIIYGLDVVSVSVADDGLRFSWEQNLGRTGQSHHDQVMVLAYFPEQSPAEAIFSLNAGKRLDGNCILQLPIHLRSSVMEVYVAVSAEASNKVSNSQYLGRVIG